MPSSSWTTTHRRWKSPSVCLFKGQYKSMLSVWYQAFKVSLVEFDVSCSKLIAWYRDNTFSRLNLSYRSQRSQRLPSLPAREIPYLTGMKKWMIINFVNEQSSYQTPKDMPRESELHHTSLFQNRFSQIVVRKRRIRQHVIPFSPLMLFSY